MTDRFSMRAKKVLKPPFILTLKQIFHQTLTHIKMSSAKRETNNKEKISGLAWCSVFQIILPHKVSHQSSAPLCLSSINLPV